MTTAALAGRAVLVVGASAGIGRAYAVGAAKAGARVVFSARRETLLHEAIAEAGSGRAVTADLAQPADCQRLAEESAAELGSIDVVLFAAAIGRLSPLEGLTAEDWTTTMAVNVVGINLAIAHLVGHLAPGAMVVVMSSETVGNPHYGMSSYGASKAALEESLRGWRNERPGVRFCTAAVGPTVPTDFGTSFDMEMLTHCIEKWATQGHARAEMMHTDEVAQVMLSLTAATLPFPGVGIENFLLRSPSAVIADGSGMTDAASSRLVS